MKKLSPATRMYLAVAGYIIVLFSLFNLLMHLLSTKGMFGHLTFPMAIVTIVVIGFLVVRGVMWAGEKAAATLMPDDEINIDKKDTVE